MSNFRKLVTLLDAGSGRLYGKVVAFRSGIATVETYRGPAQARCSIKVSVGERVAIDNGTVSFVLDPSQFRGEFKV